MTVWGMPYLENTDFIAVMTLVEVVELSLITSGKRESRLTVVSREAKKKQAVRDEQVSYLHVAPL